MDKKLTDDLRDYYELPNHITDEQVSKHTKGSLGKAVLNFSHAADGLKAAFSQHLPNWPKNLTAKIKRRAH